MRKLLMGLLLAASSTFATGCATCANCDESYGFFGGSWPRYDQCFGRVGSAFAPAGSPVIAPEPQMAPDTQERPEEKPPTREMEADPGPAPNPNAAPVPRPSRRSSAKTTSINRFFQQR